MSTIEIDFDVYKALTLRCTSEEATYNDVLRQRLNLTAKKAAQARPLPRSCKVTALHRLRAIRPLTHWPRA